MFDFLKKKENNKKNSKPNKDNKSNGNNKNKDFDLNIRDIGFGKDR